VIQLPLWAFCKTATEAGTTRLRSAFTSTRKG
jgi:hypothetical protein